MIELRKFLVTHASNVVAALAALALSVGGGQARAEEPSAPLPQVAYALVSGTVLDGAETVAFSGWVRMSSKLVPDPVFNAPSVLLTIDFSEVSGLGLLSLRKYVVPTRALVQRRLREIALGLAVSTRPLEVSFPYLEQGAGVLTAKSAIARFSLAIDVTTGQVTSLTGVVGAKT